MVIHNYDFTHMKMIRFHNTLTTISSAPTYKLIFHLGTNKDIPLLSCEEERKDGVYHMYLPDVPTTTDKWTVTIKKQLSLMLQIAQTYSSDYVSIIVGGTAKKEVAAIAFHQALREVIGAMYMIEFCVGEDKIIREIYERTISPIYRS